MTTSTKVNSFTIILKTKNQFIFLCWKKIKAYVHQLLDHPSQWQTSQQAGPGSVPKFTSTSITVKQLLIKNKNINQSKSSLLIWHYVSYLFLLFILFRIAWWPSLWKSCRIGFLLVLFLFFAVLIVYVRFPFGVQGRMWNSVVSVPDHCFFINFTTYRPMLSLTLVLALMF